MKNILYVLVIAYCFSISKIHLGNNNSKIIEQKMFINGSELEPLYLLQNESIYPFRIIQVGKIFDQVNMFFLNKTYYKYLIKTSICDYKKNKNLNDFMNEIIAIKKKIKDTFLSKFCSKNPLYRYEKIKETSEIIKKYFEGYGFLDVKIRIHINKKNKEVVVSYFIDVGKKYKISSIEIICENEKLKKTFYKHYYKSNLKKGEYVSFKKIHKETEKILRIFQNNGFLFFSKRLINFYICKKVDTSEADVVIRITGNINDSDKQFIYNKTIYKCEDKGKKYIGEECYNCIKKNIFDKYISFPLGLPYSKQYEINFYEYLYNADIFKNINLEKKLEQNNIDTEVFLGFKKHASFSFSPNFSFNNENIFLAINNKLKILNICKILDTIDIKLEAETILIRLGEQWQYFKKPQINFSTAFSYPFSFLFKSIKRQILTKYGLKIKYDYNDKKKENQNLFFANLFFKYSLILLRKINFSVKANLFESLIYKEHFNKKININPHLELLFSYTPNDKIVTNIESDVGVNKFYNGGFNSYFKISFEQIFKIHFNYHNGINMRLKIGKIFSEKKDFPDTVYFKIGGNRSLRGWSINDVGPGSEQYVDEYDKRGEILLLYNIEYNYRFNEVFSILCPFFDIGNVYEKKSSGAAEYSEKNFNIKDFYKKLHVNTGFAIRIMWKIFVIRLDIGFRIYEPTKFPVFGERYFSFIPNVNFCFGLPF